MRQRDYLEGLAALHRMDDAAERRALWRQSLADLAAAVADTRRAVPLEGLEPEALLASVQRAFATGLVDDVAFLSPAAASAALYELAAALPPCELKRELGRRVLRDLGRGDAATFVAVATQLAISSSHRALAGAGTRARVALSLDLPLGVASRADGLALALISRRELAEEWLTLPSQGALPSRVLAARLLERAAREAVRRADAGDDAGVRVFETPLVRAAWNALLADRESLVWQHVAAARGLLSRALPPLGDEVNRHLGAQHGVTEWRRAAASLAASIAVDPEQALTRAHELLRSPIATRDPGVPAAMVAGLPRAAEREPDAVATLLVELVEAGGLPAAMALVRLRRERIEGPDGKLGIGAAAAERARTLLADALEGRDASGADAGQVHLARCVHEELGPGPDASTLRARVDGALDAFVSEGAAAAAQAARRALTSAVEHVHTLEETRETEDPSRGLATFRALRELDASLLESETLASLLGLAGREQRDALKPLGELFERLTRWLLRHDVDAESAEDFTGRLFRLRALLHCVDADGPRVEPRGDVLRARRFLAGQALYLRAAEDTEPGLCRATNATAARAGDALVRERLVEVSDVVLAVAWQARSSRDVETMGEASMVPEIRAALRALARFAAATETLPDGAIEAQALREPLRRLLELGHDLPIATSPRVEALRAALQQLGHALAGVRAVASRRELAEHTDGDTALAQLESACSAFAKLVRGARRRLGLPRDEGAPALATALRALDLQLERALRSTETPLGPALATAMEALRAALPAPFARLVVAVLGRLPTLPLDGPRSPERRPSIRRNMALPAWVPATRIVGGFHVMRPIGTGASGSVFVATRAEARNDPHAERYALKTPDYAGAAARMLNEDEFLRLFREEAGTLLGLPAHPNIARFVTFDAGARPKPILVMELVEGPNLERLMEARDLDMERAVDLLEGIAAGLAAMHEAGVAHLDLKPSNIIVRDPDGARGAAPEVPVLVDFGLAGRHLRPGCGTACYGAPEVWGRDESGEGRATPADVYAFGCLAFELMTGRTLFDDPNDVAVITAHIQHDGLPEPVAALAADEYTAGFAEIVRRCMRRNPANRVAMGEVQRAIGRVRRTLLKRRWPLGS